VTSFHVAVAYDADLTVSERGAVAGLFPPPWRTFATAASERGSFTQQRPRWRVLARSAAPTNATVGHAGLVLLADHVVGLSDVVVDVDWRRLGVAGALIDAAVGFCDTHRLVCLVDTAHGGLRRHLHRLGFHPATADRVEVAGGRIDNVMVRGEVTLVTSPF
jgi:GNAT superfamily N-acetyltransferase